ncbi:Type 1 glutamine amidotransferase-like domain-containing protein [Patescibacteria group bacterium]|nr:Type 1 glutamine amidotransferase-like domain-containing protein [Patescibacteria group bacterium]MBU4452718.1 Type 1 glutamine amidotransferase-like domain-containing protein [Patescibacteria group bacterium]
MAKYILHGGGASTSNNTDAFFKEILKGAQEGDLVLLVYFARPQDCWRGCFEQDSIQMQACSSVKLSFELARPEAFDEQVLRAKVIYLCGGHTPPLLNELQRHPKFADLVGDKIVVGSSAGAYALAQYAYSIESQCVRKGLGILPVRVVAHYNGNSSILKKFPTDSEGLETVLLKEGEYQVFEK